MKVFGNEEQHRREVCVGVWVKVNEGGNRMWFLSAGPHLHWNRKLENEPKPVTCSRVVANRQDNNQLVKDQSSGSVQRN